MSLKEQMAADVDLFINLSEFGEEVDWYPDGSDVALADKVGIVFHRGSMVLDGQMVTIQTGATLMVAAVAIPDPSAGARFVRANGEQWSVARDGVEGSDGTLWKLRASMKPIPTLRSW